MDNPAIIRAGNGCTATLFSEARAKLRATVAQDEHTRAASRAFDVEFDGTIEVDLPELCVPSGDWGILLLVGPSGSGKSQLLKRHFGSPSVVEWDAAKAVVSQFGPTADAVLRLTSVGLNSVPSWLKPRHVLSTGEGHRADLARVIATGAVVDEFTSTVNREAARSAARGVRRLVDALNVKGVVLATCHYDVAEWLEPDWLFDTATGVLAPRGSLPVRPKIILDITPCSPALWPIFAPHHYLSATLNKTANCWLATWDGVPVGFCASLPFPNAHLRKAYRESRTVVLPDYQGLGVGVKLSDAIAQLHIDAGFRYFSKTAHPRFIAHREQSPQWRPTSKNGRDRQDYSSAHRTKEDGHKQAHRSRVCGSHEFVGAKLFDTPNPRPPEQKSLI